MHPKFFVLMLVSVLIWMCVEAKSKYVNEDENNPYEFGFTIDGQQHRHEKKDANGIIQGEFGFITADGVYHVTVYATDENGDFRILSMRNVRISGPLDQPNAQLPDTSQFAKSQPKVSAPLAPNPLSIDMTTTTTTTTPKPHFDDNLEFTTQATVKPGCASCGIVTHETPLGGKLPFQTVAGGDSPKTGAVIIDINAQNANTDAPFVSNNTFQGHFEPDTVHQDAFGSPVDNSHIDYKQDLPGPLNIKSGEPQDQQGNQNYEGHINYNPQVLEISDYQTAYNQTIQSSTLGHGKNENYGTQAPNPIPEGLQISDSYRKNEKSTISSTEHYQGLQEYPQITGAEVGPIEGAEPNPLSIAQPQSSVGRSGITVSNGVINVPNNPPIPIQDKYPNMVDGLPKGISQHDITDLLYKFNYTIGFHGHYEKGYKNGAKVGGYFVTDRDGVSHVVTYVADENGFQPKVKLVRLDLNSDLVPKEGTEKTFGLKNFEFIWYPLN